MHENSYTHFTLQPFVVVTLFLEGPIPYYFVGDSTVFIGKGKVTIIYSMMSDNRHSES